MDTKNGGGRSSEEIRAEIERTRADMHETVDQLEARLSPGQILDELWGRMRASGGGGVTDIVREHPVPLALMGLGVAMLAVEQSKRGHGAHGYVGSTDRADGRVGPYRGDEIDGMKFSDRATGIGSTSDIGSSAGSGSSSGASGGGHGRLDGLKDKAGDLVHGAKDAVSGVAGKVGDAAGSVREAAGGMREGAAHLADSAGARASDLRGRAGETASSAVRGLDRVIHDQPLVAGAVTFALGLVAGLAAPSTRFENERLGARSDELKETAKEAASEAGERVKAAASETAGAVKEAAREMKDVMNDDELKEALVAKAREVADVARGAVENVAQKATGQADGESGSEGTTTGGSAAGGSGTQGMR